MIDEITLKILHGSIRKWIKIATWEGYDSGSDNCPLCSIFLKNYCAGCPISEKTGQGYCEGTPYDEWIDIFNYPVSHAHDNQWVVFDEDSQKVAEKMTLFLIELLPEKERSRYYEDEK